MWTIQLDEVNHKIDIKESSSNHSLTATVSLKHKCLSYSLITINRRSNLCISSHAIKSEMYKQNQKDFLRLVVRFGYKNSLVFLGFKGLDSKRAQVLDLSQWSFLVSYKYPSHYFSSLMGCCFTNLIIFLRIIFLGILLLIILFSLKILVHISNA